MESFPLMVPDESGLGCTGMIEVGTADYFALSVAVAPTSAGHGRLVDGTVKCDARLASLVQGSEEVLRLRLAQSSSILAFLHEFRAYVLRVLPATTPFTSSRQAPTLIPTLVWQWWQRTLVDRTSLHLLQASTHLLC
jgi:hypothetical protein